MRRLPAFLLCLIGATAHGREVKIAGSDLLAQGVVPPLQAMAAREDRELAVDFSGSHSAWQALQNGGADIALISFAPGESPLAASFHAVPLAWHTVVVLLPEAVPLNQISFAQLAGVFGAGEGTGWKRWGDLGVSGEMASRSIVPRALDRPPALTLELFRHLVLRSGEPGGGLRLEPDEAAVLKRLISPEGGLALASRTPLDSPGVKVLAVSREPGGPAYAPTPAAIERGDYPLQWPVWLVFRRAEVRRLYPWLRFILGDEVARGLQAAGLQPAAPETRADRVFDLEEL